MKHRIPRSLILLDRCSQCRQIFGDGAARFLLGNHPLEQFCTYSCAEHYLQSGQARSEAPVSQGSHPPRPTAGHL